jgi:hypothetical protein
MGSVPSGILARRADGSIGAMPAGIVRRTRFILPDAYLVRKWLGHNSNTAPEAARADRRMARR